MTGRQQQAFTLAETLITLGIIGIVAALTIPTLMKNYEEHVNKERFLKMYSVLSNAYNEILLENGGTLIAAMDYNNTIGSAKRADTIRNLFASKIKYFKKCDANSTNCMPKDKNGNDYINTKLDQTTQDSNLLFSDGDGVSKLILNDGSYVSFNATNTTCDITDKFNTCVLVGIDTNGAIPPNKKGKDVHSLILSNIRLFVYGEDYFANGGTGVAWYQEYCTKTDGIGCGVLWLLNLR